jgi:sulfate permease, SulP family
MPGPVVVIQEKPTVPIGVRVSSIAQRLLPALDWLPAYRREWLLPDALAGLALWAVIGQVPPLLGLEGRSGNFFTKLWSALLHLRDASPLPVLTGLLSLVAMLLLRDLV